MPHAPWDETQPLGSAASNTIDEIFRDLKVQVRDRMNDIVVDWTADPVVLKPAGSGSGLQQGVGYIQGPHDFLPLVSSSITSVVAASIEVTDSGYQNVWVQHNWKITNFHFIINPQAATVNWYLFKYTMDSSHAQTVVASGVVSGAGITIVVAITGGTELVSAQNKYVLGFAGTGAWRYYGFKLIADEV